MAENLKRMPNLAGRMWAKNSDQTSPFGFFLLNRWHFRFCNASGSWGDFPPLKKKTKDKPVVVNLSNWRIGKLSPAAVQSLNVFHAGIEVRLKRVLDHVFGNVVNPETNRFCRLKTQTKFQALEKENQSYGLKKKKIERLEMR